MDALAQAAGIMIVSTACGMMFAFGGISACRWMKWSPIMVVNYFPNAAAVTVENTPHPASSERAGK